MILSLDFKNLLMYAELKPTFQFILSSRHGLGHEWIWVEKHLLHIFIHHKAS